MFKRGEIAVAPNDSLWLCNHVGTNYDWIPIYGTPGIQGVGVFKPNLGPVYEVDGRRFVPNGGPCRLPRDSEWYYSEASKMPKKAKHDWKFVVTPDSGGHRWTRRILLPVPDLPEDKCGKCDGHGDDASDTFQAPELRPKCDACGGTGVGPKPEFKVGDWVRYKETGKTYKVTKDNAFAYNQGKTLVLYELLPGRPLTTDDLMQVLSGKKVMVECHVGNCGDLGGVRYRITAEIGSKEGAWAWFHHGMNHVPPIASFQDGAIVFSDGIEGNIFVIEEGS